MLLCELTFPPVDSDPRQRDALEDSVRGLFAAFAKNGQVWGDELLGWVDGTLRAVCSVPRPDALDGRHHSEWVRKELATVEQHSRSLDVQVVDDRAKVVEAETWHEGAGLYLFTHMFDKTSPVCAGNDGEPVPLYLLPVEQKVRENLYGWMHRYQEMDRLQIGCGRFEIPAYTEMADPDSELAQEGRALAKTVEVATTLPSYYYLIRHWGRTEGEAERLCPGCGGSWAVDRSGEERGLGWFDFRCEPCRLVSHVADDTTEDGELYRIGEWQGATASQAP